MQKFNAKIGELIFFNSALMHKSGLNKTKNMIRYVLAAFYHDTTNKEWDFFYKNHKSWCQFYVKFVKMINLK